jgi:hypothetical protein
VPSAAIDTAIRPLSANGIETDVADRSVYVNHLRGYSMFHAVVRDSLPTRLRHAVINDAKPPLYTRNVDDFRGIEQLLTIVGV